MEHRNLENFVLLATTARGRPASIEQKETSSSYPSGTVGAEAPAGQAAGSGIGFCKRGIEELGFRMGAFKHCAGTCFFAKRVDPALWAEISPEDARAGFECGPGDTESEKEPEWLTANASGNLLEAGALSDPTLAAYSD